MTVGMAETNLLRRFGKRTELEGQDSWQAMAVS